MIRKFIISAVTVIAVCMTLNAAGLKSLQGAHIGYAVIDLRTGETTQSLNARQLFVPASTLKCVTAAAALSRLGGDYSFETQINTTGYIENDTLTGDIIITPCGDPSLGHDICNTIMGLGIRHIKGSITVRAKEPEVNSTMMLEDVGTEYGVGWSAFNYEGNRALVNDSLWSFPLQYIIDDMVADLMADGITTENIASSDTTLTASVMHRSEPLTELCAHMLAESDNLYAQSIGRALSPELKLNDALDSVKVWIKSAGLPDKSLRMVDMSGLARTNLVTPELLARLLKQMATNKDYVKCFPRAGREGTVKRLLNKTRLEGRMALKSGSMSGILAYAGYKTDATGKPTHAVVVMVNNSLYPISQVKRALEQWFLEIF